MVTPNMRAGWENSIRLSLYLCIFMFRIARRFAGIAGAI